METKKILRWLEEIEARTERATPGPWSPVGAGRPGRYRSILAHGQFVADVRVDDGGAALAVSEDDMNVIAHAREDIPWLCQVVRDLLKRLGACEEFLRAMQRFQDQLVCDICGERLERGMVYCAHEACWKAREERLRKLEEVVKAARALIQATQKDALTWYGEAWWLIDLERALAALEEGDDGTEPA